MLSYMSHTCITVIPELIICLLHTHTHTLTLDDEQEFLVGSPEGFPHQLVQCVASSISG